MHSSLLLTSFAAVLAVQAMPTDLKPTDSGGQSYVVSESFPAGSSTGIPNYSQQATDTASTASVPAYGSSSVSSAAPAYSTSAVPGYSSSAIPGDSSSASTNIPSSTAAGSQTTGLPPLTSMETSIIRSSTASLPASDSSSPPEYTSQPVGESSLPPAYTSQPAGESSSSSTGPAVTCQPASTSVPGHHHHESSTKAPCDESRPTQAPGTPTGKNADNRLSPADELEVLKAACEGEPESTVCIDLRNWYASMDGAQPTQSSNHNPHHGTGTQSYTHTSTASAVTSIVTVHHNTQAVPTTTAPVPTTAAPAPTSTAPAGHSGCDCGEPEGPGARPQNVKRICQMVCDRVPQGNDLLQTSALPASARQSAPVYSSMPATGSGMAAP